MTPKKTKSGKWHVTVFLGRKDGKMVRASVTADTKRQCQDRAALLRAQGLPEIKPKREPLGQCIDRYIESSELLSPTRLAGYRKIRRTRFEDVMDVTVEEITNESLQKAINAEARRKSKRGHNISAKSIRNAYGLISASVRAFYGKVYNIRLPESDPHFLELPEPELVMDAVYGSDIELPCLLALWLSFSMSEVRGFRYSSIRNGKIYVDQVVVDVDGVPTVKKKAKVATRNRCLRLPKYIMELIRKQTAYNDYEAGRIFDDWLCPMPEYTIRRKLLKLYPGITFHQLRHMNASVMLLLRIPEKYASERGGWKTPATMHRVYEHPFDREREAVADIMDDYYQTIVHNVSAHKAATR